MVELMVEHVSICRYFNRIMYDKNGGISVKS